MMKGQVLELVIIFVILAMIAITLSIGLKVYNELFESEAMPNTATGNISQAAARESFDVVNFAFPLLLGGLSLVTIISAFMIRVSPIFFIVSVSVLVIVVVVSAPITNAFMGVLTDEGLADESAEFDIALHTVGMFPLIAVVVGFLIIIALHAKSGDGGGL